MIDLNNFQSINLSQFFDSVKFRSGSGYHSVIDFRIVIFYLLRYSWNLILFRKLFSDFFLGSWPGSGFYYKIRWNKLFIIYWRYPPNLVTLRKVYVKIKILFRIRIRIKIMILLQISIPDLRFIHRRHPPNFVWIL